MKHSDEVDLRKPTIEIREDVKMGIRRNQPHPITRLPPELLAKIFFYTALLNALTLKGSEYFSAIPDVWSVIFVCRYWSEVALNSPSLWSWIDVSGQKTRRLQKVLERSKRASLNIFAKVSSPERTKGLRLALTQLHRAKTLEINLRGPTTPLYLDDNLSTSAPRLTRFVMRDMSQGLSFNHTPFIPPIHIGQPYNFLVNPSHPFFVSSLTHLVFVTFSKSHVLPTQVSDLIHVLSRMTRLQHLEYASPLADDNMTHQVVELAQLKYLECHNRESTLAFSRFLDQLCISQSTTVLLDIRSTTRETISGVGPLVMASVGRLLAGKGRIGSALPVKSISGSIVHRVLDNYAFDFWTDLDMITNDSDATFQREPIFRLFLPFTHREEWCQHLPLSDVEACAWKHEWGFRGPIKPLRNLKWLKLIGEFSKDLPRRFEDLANPEEPSLKTKLETLFIEKVHFRQLPEDDVQYIRDLASALSKFSSLQNIELRKCTNFFAKDLEVFADMKLSIRWDEEVDENNHGICYMGEPPDDL